jgi:hypothetical protein
MFPIPDGMSKCKFIVQIVDSTLTSRFLTFTNDVATNVTAVDPNFCQSILADGAYVNAGLVYVGSTAPTGIDLSINTSSLGLYVGK